MSRAPPLLLHIKMLMFRRRGFLVCKQQRKIALISNRHDSGGKNVLLLHITLGIYEVFLERSGRKILVKPEPRSEPYIPCYMTRVERSGTRAQRGLSSEFRRLNLMTPLLLVLVFLLHQYLFCKFCHFSILFQQRQNLKYYKSTFLAIATILFPNHNTNDF